MHTDHLADRLDEVDDLHRRQMETFHDESAELHAAAAASGSSRRRFLTRTGVGAAALTIGPAVVPISRLIPSAAAQELTDVDIGVFAESVELAAVAAYEAAAGTGLLSDAVAEAGTLFAQHHQEHAAAFAALVGDAATGEPNQAVLDVYAPMIANASDETTLVQIALELEEGAAATYHFGLGAIQDPTVATAPAQILPVESMHAVVLSQVLGLDIGTYVPSFQTSDAALNPADFPVGG